MKKSAVAAAVAVAVFASLSVPVALAASKTKAVEAPKTCDRACLIGVVDTYLSAVGAHDPSKAPLAADVKFVENVKRMKPGEGLWKSATTLPTTFKIYVPDPASQQVGFIGVLRSDGKNVELGLRLKLENGKITEAEHIVAEVRETSMPQLQKPRMQLLSPVPDDYRDAHGRLLHIAATYYDALDNNNGSLAPFADDCVRMENGMQTVRNPVPADPSQGFGLAGALGCAKQLDTNTFEYIDRIENRRVWIADEVNGIAIGFSHFRHPMTKREFAVYGIPGQTVRKMPDQKPFDMPAAHIFKIWGGQIHEIEAVGVVEPYNSPTGWE
ncbi:MAG: hypothetical protein WDO68_08140 [Gammaproteobacteria bacterium]